VSRYIRWNVAKSCTTVLIIPFEKACSLWVNLKVIQDRQNYKCYSTSYTSLLVVCINNVSILHDFWDVAHLQCTWLAVTLRSPWVWMRQLKLQVTCAFWFMCKHIIVSRCCSLLLEIVQWTVLNQFEWNSKVLTPRRIANQPHHCLTPEGRNDTTSKLYQRDQWEWLSMENWPGCTEKWSSHTYIFWNLEFHPTHYQAITIYWLLQTSSQNSFIYPPRLVHYTPSDTSASDSSMLEFVRYTNFVMIIVIIIIIIFALSFNCMCICAQH